MLHFSVRNLANKKRAHGSFHGLAHIIFLYTNSSQCYVCSQKPLIQLHSILTHQNIRHMTIIMPHIAIIMQLFIVLAANIVFPPEIFPVKPAVHCYGVFYCKYISLSSIIFHFLSRRPNYLHNSTITWAKIFALVSSSSITANSSAPCI